MEFEYLTDVTWNGVDYTFSTKFENSAFKHHLYLEMVTDSGTWTGEEAWINRPWHRFEYEPAFYEIVSNAFGSKAVEIAKNACSESHDISEAIKKFFNKLNPEDVDKGGDDLTEHISKEEALAKYLEVNVDDIEHDTGDYYSCDGDEYLVLTNDEADDLYTEYIESSWQDYLAPDQDLEYILDDDKVEEGIREDAEYQVEDMEDSEILEDCVKRGLCDEGDVLDDDGDALDEVDVDEYRDMLIDDIVENTTFDDFLSMFDRDYISENFIDEDKAIQEVKDMLDGYDGRAGVLAPYNGEEIELEGDYYAYKC